MSNLADKLDAQLRDEETFGKVFEDGWNEFKINMQRYQGEVDVIQFIDLLKVAAAKRDKENERLDSSDDSSSSLLKFYQVAVE